MVIRKEQSVYLLAGTEQFLKEKHLAQFRSAFLDKKSQEFNINVFYPGSTQADKILECACNAPFLGKKRMVVVRQLENFSAADKELILSYLKAPYKHTVLILETHQTNLNDGFFRQIRKYAQVILCNQLSGDRLFNWIAQQVKARGKKIEPKAQKLLINNLGDNLELLSRALDSLVLFIGKKEVVGAADVEKLVGRDVDVDAFKLFKAIDAQDKEKTFQILDSLLKDGIKSTQILGALTHEILSARGRLGTSYIARFLQNLQKADSDIKTGRQNSRFALELLMVSLLRP